MALKYSLTFSLVLVCHCSARPTVETLLGTVRGYILTSHGGKKFSAFEGIPYAKPPIGERRFEPPEAAQPWHGVWDANYTSECAQLAVPLINLTQVDEDCLHINVYVPRKSPYKGEDLEVIVHIHGGAYMYGSGHLYANPQFLMDREVVFVTFNYRLGVLGFLSTEDDVVPGNNGLKDQVMALRWVQDNIASFGGNPNSVTLTGLSAGGSSVHLHYFSKMSEGLFHRGFSQSGVALNTFALQKDAANKAKRLGEAVGCPITSTRVMVDCLKQRPYKQLIDKTFLFFVLPYIPSTPFAPVIEKQGSNPFLSDNPFELLYRGELQKLPWIASNTAHEGLSPVLLNVDFDTINYYWELLAPILLEFNHVLSKWYWMSTTRKIKKFYLKNKQVDETNFYNFVQMFSDRNFLVDTETAVKWQAKVTNSPVYYFYFSYIGDNNENKTVKHSDDIKYYFGSRLRQLSPNELKMKDVLLDMLVTYAKTGKPEIVDVKWDPTTHDKLTYLNISSFEPREMESRTTADLTPREFWKSLGFSENENLVSDKIEL